jgi:hypothetical protein
VEPTCPPAEWAAHNALAHSGKWASNPHSRLARWLFEDSLVGEGTLKQPPSKTTNRAPVQAQSRVKLVAF